MIAPTRLIKDGCKECKCYVSLDEFKALNGIVEGLDERVSDIEEGGISGKAVEVPYTRQGSTLVLSDSDSIPGIYIISAYSVGVNVTTTTRNYVIALNDLEGTSGGASTIYSSVVAYQNANYEFVLGCIYATFSDRLTFNQINFTEGGLGSGIGFDPRTKVYRIGLEESE